MRTGGLVEFLRYRILPATDSSGNWPDAAPRRRVHAAPKMKTMDGFIVFLGIVRTVAGTNGITGVGNILLS